MSDHEQAEHPMADEEHAGGHPPPNASGSERYELEDLFQGEAPENQHFLKVAGLVLLVAFLALALAFPLRFALF